MGIYYFAVDYAAEEQMWAPGNFSNKCPYCPGNPLPYMIVFKNCTGSNFEVVRDVSTYEEHEFKNVTEEVYEEWKTQFPWTLLRYYKMP
jgi:hypothetical protein